MTSGESRAVVAVSLLGGFAVVVDGAPTPDRWRLRKAKTLVKLLALAPGHRLHRDVVVELLWPEAEPGAATNNLHQAVHAVRQVLGAARIALRADVLYLCPDDELIVDVDVFERAAVAARSSGDVTQLRSALESWTGTLLPEDEFESWSEPHRERLAETHAATMTLLATRLVETGDADSALAVLEALATERPLDEPVQRARIAALSASGRRWDAILAYEQLRDALEREYAAEPEPATKALYRRLLSGSAALASATPHNLPEPATSFIGRQRDLHELATSLGRTRLLTLTGPGGAGKSRLAVEAARRAAGTPEFPDGVWWVELAGVKDSELVASTAASALRLTLPRGSPSTSALADQLAARRALLILDNCEHLLAASAAVVAEILARCPDVSIVCTSREPLGADGEVVYRVPSLDVPAESANADLAELSRLAAVQLFVERARQAARFELQSANAAAVVQICRRLDGMPLALELAAARLAHLSAADLAAGLGDALSLLARRGGTRLDRQQTLAATLDWSHALLEPDEQVAFRRLAVFAGGFDLDAGINACGAAGPAVELISRLVDKSLVEADTSGPTARYRLLEVVRQYADARLTAAGEDRDARRRHREWFAAAAAARDPDRGDEIVGEPSLWFDAEQDNLRAALSSALADDPPLALALATSTWRFWVTRGLIAEGSRWLALALDACSDRSAVRARALAATCVLEVRQGRGAELAALGDEIVDLLAEQDDPAELAYGRHHRAVLAFMSGEWAQATELCAAALRDAAAFPAVSASGHHLAGVIAGCRGDFAGARDWFTTAQRTLAQAPAGTPPYFLAITLAWSVDQLGELPLLLGEETMLLGRRIGARQAACHVATTQAFVERLSGRVESALALIDDARAGFDALGDRYGRAYVAAQRGHTLRWAGDFEQADRALAESESIRRELRDQRSVAMAVSGRAIVAAAAGDGKSARVRGREALQMMERTGDTPGTYITYANLGAVEMLLGDPAAGLGWVRRSLSLPNLPGGYRAHSWLRLIEAHLLRETGDRAAADAAAAIAQDLFRGLGDEGGLAALQRACKAGLLSVEGNEVSGDDTSGDKRL